MNPDAKLIKTATGIHGTLYYEYTSFSSARNGKPPTITFDNRTNVLYIPLLISNYSFTRKYTRYKFTGKYFEKIKG